MFTAVHLPAFTLAFLHCLRTTTAERSVEPITTLRSHLIPLSCRPWCFRQQAPALTREMLVRVAPPLSVSSRAPGIRSLARRLSTLPMWPKIARPIRVILTSQAPRPRLLTQLVCVPFDPLQEKVSGPWRDILTSSIAADACHPTIILPSKIRSLDPAWVSCVPDRIGG